MGRIRTIKPDFPQSQTITRLSRDGRLLYIQLWTIADDDGRAVGAPGIISSLLYPLDEDARGLVEEWLSELEAKGCIRRYEVDGKLYLDIPNWLKHQKIDRPSPSKLPVYSPNPRRNLDEPSAKARSNSTVSGREGTGTGNGTGTGTFPLALAPSEQRAPLEATRARSANRNSQPSPPADPPQEVADDEDAQRLEIIKRRSDREALVNAIKAKHEMDRTPTEKMILKNLDDYR